MKKFFAIVMYIFGGLFIMLFLLGLIGASQDPSVGIYIALTLMLIVPAALLIIGGYFLFRSSNKKANGPHFESVVTRSTVSSSKVTNSNVDFSNDDLNELVGNFFGTAQRPSSVPFSVDCSGCGAKVTVPSSKSAKCEYCGTVVRE